MINSQALFKVSYGIYIVCSGNKEKGNGFIANTVFQVASEPVKFAVCCNKNNYTSELIQKTGAFSASVLEINTQPQLFSIFGYKSGRDIDKMGGFNVKYGQTGTPIVLDSGVAFLEFKLVDTIDVGTHYMFIGDLLNAEVIDDSKEPITYQYYRQVKHAISPKIAPTYIDVSKLELKVQEEADLKKYKCTICGYIYDEAKEEVKFKDLPEDWTCPLCGAEKTDFIEI